MPFLTLEGSNYDGEPVLLYEFRRGDLRSLYVGADRNVQVGADTYLAVPISNGGANQKGEPVTDMFVITAPKNIAPATWYRYTPPSELVYVVVRRFHYGDSEGVVVWIGSIVSVATTDEVGCTINCQAVSVSLKRGGLRLAWQRGCPHALYDQNCQADKAGNAVVRTVTGISPYSFEINSSLSTSVHTWGGGYIEWTVGDGSTERRMIEQASGTTITPYGNLDGYTVGMTLTVYPGCLRTSVHCISAFNNLANFGGFPFMPDKSPYDGDPVF